MLHCMPWLILVFESPVAKTAKNRNRTGLQPVATGLLVAVCSVGEKLWFQFSFLAHQQNCCKTGSNRFQPVTIYQLTTNVNLIEQQMFIERGAVNLSII